MDIPVVKQGKYITVDTTIKSTDVMYIDEMSGDLGDANRKVYLAIKERPESNDPKDPLIPMNLNGRDVRFQGHDADGMYKRISLATKIINAKAGLVEMTLPRQLYMAVGSYNNAEFEVYEVNGDTNVSTVPVGLEVYDNLVHMSVGENKVYIDEAEKLISDLEKLTNQSLDSMRKSLGSMENGVTDALANIKRLETLVDIWQQMVKDNGVAETAGNNVMTGTNVFERFIQGHVTGTVIKRFGSEDAVQDLNNLEALRGLKTGTSESTYYGANKVENNPMQNDWLLVSRQKVSDGTAYETAITFNGDYGVIKARSVTGLTATPKLNTWKVVSEWGGQWLPLSKYLTSNFVPGEHPPMYRVVGDHIEFVGLITPKVNLANDTSGVGKSWDIISGLPVEFESTQARVQVGAGWSNFAMLTGTNGRVVMQKHGIAGKPTDVVAGGYYDISSTLLIKRGN